MRVLRVLAAALCALGLSRQAEAAPEGVAKVRVAADNAFAGGDMKTAISLLSKLIELEPANERNFYKVGYGGALVYGSLALTQSVDGNGQRFRAYLSERKYSHALSDLTSSLEVNPSYKQGILQRGKLLMMLGQCADAAHDFQKVVELYPTDATAAENLAKSTRCAAHIDEAERAQSRGDYEAAYEFLTQVLEESAVSSVPLLLERAQLSVSLMNPYDAIADLGTILKLESSNLVALQMRGQVLYSLGDRQSLDASLTHYRQGLHSDPEHTGLKKLYRQLKKLLKFMGNAEDEMARGAFDEAEEDWQSALSVDPAHAQLNKDLYLQLCECQLKLKKYADAQRSCEQAIALDDSVALAFAKLSEAQQGLEQFEEAVRSAKRAYELDDSSREFKEGVHRAEAALKQSKNKNYYKILGVARDADPKEIKKAYRKMALEWHPDKHADKAEEEREQVQKRFHDIAEAYEILSDEETRARYDRGEDVTGSGGQQPQGRPFNPFGNGNFFQQGGRTFHFNF